MRLVQTDVTGFAAWLDQTATAQSENKSLGTHPPALCTPILAVQLPKVVALATRGDTALNAETGQKLAHASIIRCAAVSNLQDVRRQSHFDSFSAAWLPAARFSASSGSHPG